MLFDEIDLFDFISENKSRLLDLIEESEDYTRYAYLAGQIYSYTEFENFLNKKINKEC